MEIVIVCIQVVALLLLARTIQENTTELKKQNVDFASIKATNQRTILIFLLMETLTIIAILNFENVTLVLKKLLSIRGI